MNPRFRKIAFVYLAILHAAFLVVLFKSDAIPRVTRKLSGAKPQAVKRGSAEDYAKGLSDFTIRRTETITDKTKVVFIGDSITAGLCVESVFGAVNLAFIGESFRGAKARTPKFKNLSGKTLVVALGINDLLNNNPNALTDFAETVSALPKDAAIIVNAVLPVEEGQSKEWPATNKAIDAFNESLRAASKKFTNVRFVDTSAPLRDERGQLARSFHIGDGIHLSKAGYDKWIPELRKVIGQ